MGEERVDMPLTPEIIEPKGSSRRNSIGRPLASNSGEKNIPHYLRASTGSCHDICKYGGRHTFLATENHPVLKGKKLTSSEDQHPIMTTTLAARLQARKKKPSVPLTSSPDPGTQIGNLPKMNKQATKPTKQTALLPGQKTLDVVKSSVVLKPKRSAENSPSPLNPTRDQSVRKGADEKTGKHVSTSKTGLKNDLVLPKNSLHPKASVNNITSLRKEKHQGMKSVSPRRTEHKAKREEPIDEKVSEKTLYVVEPELDKRTLGSNGASPLKNENKAEEDETEILANVGSNGASPLKNENKAEEDETEILATENISEKTLYGVEPNPENQNLKLDTAGNRDIASLSSPSTSSSSTPSLPLYEKEEFNVSENDGTETDSMENETETDSGYDGSLNGDEVQITEEGCRRRPRRAATGEAEDNDPTHKLKFRRGKVVDPQSQNSAPRRLRFRRGRVLGEEQDGKVDVSRQNFKKTQVTEGPTSEAESEKVVLKHQDVNAKKDGQGCLLNNVIEETASKLVETRMSKVKALVGAFETVISLKRNNSTAVRSV